MRVLLILNGVVVALLGLFLFAVLTAPYNPFVLVFLGEVEIQNNTGHALAITPIVTWGVRDERGSTTVYADAGAAWPSFDQANIVVERGQSRRVRYDSERARLSELVIAADQQVRQLVVTKPTGGSDGVLKIAVADFSSLPEVTPDVRLAYQSAIESDDQFPVWLQVCICFLVSVVTLIAMVWKSRSNQPLQPTSGGEF